MWKNKLTSRSAVCIRYLQVRANIPPLQDEVMELRATVVDLTRQLSESYAAREDGVVRAARCVPKSVVIYCSRMSSKYRVAHGFF